MSWWRAPLLHYALLGGLLHAASTVWTPARAQPVLRVDAARQEQLVARARSELAREPSPEEIAFYVEQFVDEELLFREALARGWQRSDPVVQLRLLRNMRFLDGEGADPSGPGDAGGAGDPEALLAGAYALGLERSDPVVRRRLVQRMRLTVAAAVADEEPDDAALRELRDGAPARFERPALVQLTQVFVSRDRHGERLDAAARERGARIAREALGPEAAAALSDPLPLPTRLPLSSERSIAARLGPEFARRVVELEPEGWHGPVPSSYGLHWVWVHQRQPPRMPAVEELRRELTAAWRARREERALRAALGGLRARTEVRVESIGR